MFRVRFAVTALYSLLLLPQFARAEPLPPTATYTTTIVLANGQDSLYHGPFQLWDETAGENRTVHGYTSLPDAMNGTIEGGAGEIRLAGQSKESYVFTDSAPTPGGPNDTNAFRIRVEVTDFASGESGILEFGVRGGLITGLPDSQRGEALLYSDFSAASALVLGRNRYEIAVEAGDTESTAWLLGKFTVVETVPEPTTLALAGMGLVPLLGLRRKYAV